MAGDFVHDLSLAFPYVWGFFLAYVIGQPLLEPDNRRYSVRVYKSIRPRHVAANLLVAGLTVLAYFALSRAVPALNVSWISLLGGLGPEGSTGGGSGGANALVAPINLPLFGPVFALILLANFPLLTRAEERLFRAGTSGYLSALPRSLAFGLAHCLVGIPLAAGLALAIPGLWFSHHYLAGERLDPSRVRQEPREGKLYAPLRRLPIPSRVRRIGGRSVADDEEGVERATVNHTCYNALIILVVGLIAALVLLAG